jgi:hypothetical protein
MAEMSGTDPDRAGGFSTRASDLTLAFDSPVREALAGCAWAARQWIVSVIVQPVRHGHGSGSTRINTVLARDRLWLQQHIKTIA